MPQTTTGLILFAALFLSGTGAGASAAKLVTTRQDHRAIERRDVVTASAFGVLVVVSALLLAWVEGR
jgi:uncharacterized membrane protein SpoIIM required for sporulation